MGKHHVCPWKAGPLLTTAFRKLLHNPHRISGPYLSKRMTAMDVGFGMGFFTILMADIVGEQGKVVAVDLQPEMLAGLKKNAEKAGMKNIAAHQCGVNSLRTELWSGTVENRDSQITHKSA